MTTAIKRRRGTTAQHATFTGLEGEITVDTTKDTLVVHDGATAGGFALLREDLSNNTNVITTTNTKTLTNKTFGDNPTFSAGTANGVAYLNGSKVLTTGSALTFDGTTLSNTVSDSAVAQKIKAASGLLEVKPYVDSTYGGWIRALNSAESGYVPFSLLGSTVNSYFSTNATWNQIGGTEAMRLTSTGLGIGTSSPGVNLDIVGTTNNSNGQLRLSTSSSFGTRMTFVNTATNGRTWQIGSNFAVGNGEFAFVDSTAGATRMQIDSSGNLGLGVTPSAWSGNNKVFQLSNGAALLSRSGFTGVSQNLYYNASDAGTYIANGYAALYHQTNGQHVWSTAPSGTAGNAISFTQAMTLDASGNLLVGTTGGVTNTIVKNLNGGEALIVYNNNNTSPYGMACQLTAASPNNTTNYFLYCADSSAQRITLRSNGGIANYQANNVNLSDRREKTDFAPAKNYLDVICDIPVQTFKYIDQTDDDLTLGVVAQDVQAVAPELVSESNWGTEDAPKIRLSIYQTDLQYALMKCIQELKAELDATKAEVAALKGN